MRRLHWILLLVVALSLMGAPVALAAPATAAPTSATVAQTCGYWYQVRWGDTLNAIAWRTGVSVGTIMQANGLTNPNYIPAGLWLWIPCPPAPPPPPPPPQPPPPNCGYWYPVRWGDTMYSIAWRTGVNAWTIAQANGIRNINYIYAGQSLWIPCPY